MSQKELRRVLSKLGVASRKQSENIVRSGVVSVNGKVITDPFRPINNGDKILINNQPISKKVVEIYALNKPRGYVTTMAIDENRPKVLDLIPKDKFLFPVGRLDKASRGLLLFTNDNNLSDILLSPDSKIDKVYRVQIKGSFMHDNIEIIKKGIKIEGENYSVKDINLVRTNPKTSWLEITLNEGKNREIRKILNSFGYEVLDLIRIQIGKLKLENLKINAGEYKLIIRDMIV